MKSIASIEKKNRSILMTGASSGIGYQAALQMLARGHRLILPCRNNITSKSLLEDLTSDLANQIDYSHNVYTPLLDLSDLNSVKSCVDELLLRNVEIDTIVLNAGLQYTGDIKPRWSTQKYELTFAVNHLGHQYLCEGILPILLKSRIPRIVVTASEVHNPEAPGGKFGKPAGLGELRGLIIGEGHSMIDGLSEFDADKAYKDSKLCNILFAKELSSRLDSQGWEIPIIAWAPGLVIPRTQGGFFRYSRKYNRIGQLIFAALVRDLLRITETPVNAGKLLMQIATENKYEKVGFTYFSNKVVAPGKRIFEESQISNEASGENISRLLWERTNALIKKFNE